MKIINRFLAKKFIKFAKETFNIGSYSRESMAFEYWDNQDKDYVGAVYNAIDTWGLYFAKAKFRLYESNGSTTSEVLDHPFLNLFNNPNSYQNWWDIRYKIAGHFGLFGSSYIWVRRNTLTGEPQIYQQLPSMLIERVHEKKAIDYYKLLLPNEVKIPVEDMIDFRYPDPRGDAVGMAIASTVMSQKEVNSLQMDYMKKFFKEGGFIGQLFTTDQPMSRSNFDFMLKKLQERYGGGVDNSYQVSLMDSGLKPVKSAYSIKDMDIENSRKTTKDDIYEAWKVPKILVGGGEGINRNTADAAIFQFTSGIIDPILNYIDSILTVFVRRNWGMQFRVTHDTQAPRDQKASLEYYSAGLKEGWLTLNEVREAENLNPIKGDLADVSTINVGGALIRVDTGEQISVEASSGGSNQEPKSVKEFDDTTKIMKWKQFDNVTEKASRRFNRKIEGYIDDQRRRLLEAVKDNFVVEGVFRLEDEDMILWQLLEIEVYSIMSEGHRFGSFKYNNDALFSKARLERDFEGIASNNLLFNQTTYENLKAIKGNDYNEVESLINNAYADVKERTINMAITTTTGAFNAGLFRAMKEAGITKKMWLTQRDLKVRSSKGTHLEDHRIMDGVLIGIDEYFEVPSRSGKDLMLYPGDPSGSPENIINDRCTIIGEE